MDELLSLISHSSRWHTRCRHSSGTHAVVTAAACGGTHAVVTAAACSAPHPSSTWPAKSACPRRCLYENQETHEKCQCEHATKPGSELRRRQTSLGSLRSSSLSCIACTQNDHVTACMLCRGRAAPAARQGTRTCACARTHHRRNSSPTGAATTAWATQR